MRDAVQIENPEYPHEYLFNEGVLLAQQGKTLDAAKKIAQAMIAGSEKAYKIFYSNATITCTAIDLTAKYEEPEELYKLGLCYSSGIGVALSYPNAAKCFLSAAKLGHINAQIRYARILLSDSDIHLPLTENQRNKEAVKLLLAAAQAGELEAQVHLGCLYEKGLAEFKSLSQVERVKQADYWFKLAAEKGYAKAQEAIGVLYYNCVGINGLNDSERMTIACKWLQKASDNGIANAQYWLGIILIHDLFTIPVEQASEHLSSAFKFLTKASEAGNALAQFKLGDIILRMTYSDEDSFKNEGLALYLLRESARSGHEPARKLLIEQRDTPIRDYNLSILDNKHEDLALDFLFEDSWEVFQAFDKETLHGDHRLFTLVSQATYFLEGLKGLQTKFIERIAEIRLILFIRHTVDFSLAEKINFSSLSVPAREEFIMHLYGIYIDAKAHEELKHEAKNSSDFLITLYKDYRKHFPMPQKMLVLAVVLENFWGDDYIVTASLPSLTEEESNIAITIASSEESGSSLTAALKKSLTETLEAKNILVKKQPIASPVLTSYQQASEARRSVVRDEAVSQDKSSKTLKHKRRGAG